MTPHPLVATDSCPHPTWGSVVIGQGLGGAIGTLTPWSLATKVVLRHRKEDDANL
jgi:hypothetical protein